MSRADELFLQNCREILAEGIWDTDQAVRPRWEDGTPAHTIKKFGIVNRYDLREEFPILTLRRTYWKTAVKELLWIWQKKSNNIRDLDARIWDQWADETGSIGKAYGYQLGVKHHYPEGDMDQVDRVLYDLKHNPASRRILTNIYNFQDLSEMRLYPCAYSMTFNVSGNTLNAILNQRSQDMLTANNWNVVQYAVLVHMFAQVSGLIPGELVHVIADAHIYDRHVPIVQRMLEETPAPAPAFSVDPAVADFYAFTPDSFHLEGYTPAPLKRKFLWQFEVLTMNAIVITDRRWAIGRDGGLLFSLPTDMRHFREHTLGGTVILGRRTLDSFPGGKALPGRRNIVVTRQTDFVQEDVETAPTLEEAAALAGDGENVWVIGGGSVYAGLLNRCRRVVLTRVDTQAEGADTFFPNLDKLRSWELVSSGEPITENGLTFRFLEYVNIASAPEGRK